MAKGRFADVEAELEGRIEALGYELVECTWGGSSRRPILRLRVDRPGSTKGDGVTVSECARVSRGLEPWLDGLDSLPERYVLEVSSPGVERPLSRPADWTRFAGEEIALKTKILPEGRGARMKGILLGSEEGPEGLAVRIRLKDGNELSIPREEITEARLVHRWE